MKLTDLETRLASLVIERKLARREDVVANAERRARGDKRPLGRILVDAKVVTQAQVDRLIDQIDPEAPFDTPTWASRLTPSQEDAISTLPIGAVPDIEDAISTMPIGMQAPELELELELGGPPSPRPTTGRPATGRPTTGRPATGRPPAATGRPPAATGRPATGRPPAATGRPATGRPATGRPPAATGRPATGRPPAATGRPTTGRPLAATGRRPAAPPPSGRQGRPTPPRTGPHPGEPAARPPPSARFPAPPLGLADPDGTQTLVDAPVDPDGTQTLLDAPVGAPPSATFRRQTERLDDPTPALGGGGETLIAPPDYADEVAAKALEVSGEALAAGGFRLGDYELLDELGRGGMGVVYRAFSTRLERHCAVKTIRAGEDASPRAVRRFRNEAVLAARLRHPNVVGVFDAGEADERLFIVMELVEGVTLEEWIKEVRTPQELVQGLRLILGAARGLAYAHEQGVTHRDVKPDNILVDKDGQARLTDFGLAMGGDDTRGLTMAGRMVGTLNYIPPEQANGELGRIGPLSDVYGLGATLYHLLAGEAPFSSDDDAVQVLYRVLRIEPEPPSEIARARGRPPVSLDLETICLKAMQKEAAARYESPAALADDLQAVLEGRPISARPLGVAERLTRALRRKRGAVASALVLASLAMLLALAFGGLLASQAQSTGETLRAFDRAAALEQASTVERAIRVDMLTGRADLARALVDELRQDSHVEVVRPDRTLAYVDGRTRKRVAARIERREVRERAAREFPQLVASIDELKRNALPAIDRVAKAEGRRYPHVDPVIWREVLSSREPRVVRAELEGQPHLIVLQPIENSRKCQVCHGPPATGGGLYDDDNRVRAVVAIHRSQVALESRIRSAQETTALVGVATVLGALALLLVLARLLKLSAGDRTYGLPQGTTVES